MCLNVGWSAHFKGKPKIVHVFSPLDSSLPVTLPKWLDNDAGGAAWFLQQILIISLHMIIPGPKQMHLILISCHF